MLLGDFKLACFFHCLFRKNFTRKDIIHLKNNIKPLFFHQVRIFNGPGGHGHSHGGAAAAAAAVVAKPKKDEKKKKETDEKKKDGEKKKKEKKNSDKEVRFI